MDAHLAYKEEDVIKANWLLAGIIGTFIVLIFIAYLLNEGRKHYVIPILRIYHPTCGLVLQLNTEKEERKSLADDVANHAIHVGVKRPSQDLLKF